MGLFVNKRLQTDIAAMPIITDEDAAAILFGAQHNTSRTTQSVVGLFTLGILYGNEQATSDLDKYVQIDLGEEKMLFCPCCDSTYILNTSDKSLTLTEGSGCQN